MKYELVKIYEYDGTRESLKMMVANLNLEPHNYFYNSERKEVLVRKEGIEILYKPGCVYQVLLPEEFPAIG